MRTHSPARIEPLETAPSDFAWRVIALVNLYRLIVSAGLFVAARFDSMQELLGIESPGPLAVVAAAWLFAGIGLIALRRLPFIGLRLLALTHALLDAVAMGFVLWSAGGVESGLGILVLLPVAAMAMLVVHRDALFMAASAALAVLVQQITRGFPAAADPAGYLNAGLLGAVIFLAALLPRLLVGRLLQSEALVRRQEVDLANLAQLSQYIVAKLRESILVVDVDDRIRLINEPAGAILGTNAGPGALLGECSPRLLYLLSGWRQHGSVHENGNFTAADGARLIQPHFAQLGTARPGPVLIFLEDTSLIAEKVQQSKLAALGRLSASIAHEIRTPIGAMSHAGQLLAESPHATGEDGRLTRIIRDNAERVSRIVDNVLELSRRSTRRPQRVDLPQWIGEFWAEFCATQQVSAADLHIAVSADEGTPLDVSVDPTQLHQVMWNLCQNALVHGRAAATGLPVEIRYGRLATGRRPFVEVRDHGPGIAAEDTERIFEPFFTRAARGTGLGLFLARELAESNGAALIHESPPDGGTLFRLVFTDPGRWEG
jgi:two-component system sensor histidine kinase PilS (NtrC family)